MTRAFHWLVPHPFVTLLLAVVWMLLQNEVSAGMVVFGIILGVIIPGERRSGGPNAQRVSHWQDDQLQPYGDVGHLVANIQVAWIVLTVPNAKLKPAWIVVPLELRQPEAITVLAGTITLTPGTVSAICPTKGTACWCMCCTLMIPMRCATISSAL